MSLTTDEMRRALAVIKRWPVERREELQRMTQNEREWHMLAAAYLDAQPVENFPKSEGAPE